jgi:hypothetical protein
LARLIASNPYQEARIFQLQLFSLAVQSTWISAAGGSYLNL